MTKEELIQVISQGENEQIEFKRSSDMLPDSVWETYSAFANTDGGTIVLGVSESKPAIFEITGIKDPQKMIKDFWNTINNPQKVNANILFNKYVSIVEIESKYVIAIEVPKANRHDRPIYLNYNILTGTYRRNADGDYKCSQDEIKTLLRDQSDISQDSATYDEIIYTELLTETFRRYRNRFKNLKPNHIWNNLDDDEFLLKIGAVKQTHNRLIPTLAGIVTFCSDTIITSILPNFFLDYREKSGSDDLRWSDRISSGSRNWSGNVFDFYFSIVDKILTSARVPFQLNGINRIDETSFHQAIRESVANAIIHADYHGLQGIVIEKLPYSLRLQNPGGFRIAIPVAKEGGVSDPRNSFLFKLFSLVGIGERAGSGLHAIYYTWQQYQLSSPVIEQRLNPDRVSLLLNWEGIEKSSGEIEKSSGEIEKSSGEIEKSSGETEKSSGKTAEKIISIIRQNNHITIPEISELLGITSRAVEKQLENLKIQGRVFRKGSNKSGYWEVLK